MKSQKRSLYQRALGAAFETMPLELRLFHSLEGRHQFHGDCVVTGAETLAGKIVSFLLRLPRQTDGSPLTFVLHADQNSETWIRYFPLRTMRSVMRVQKRNLVERLGPVTFYFSLKADGDQLTMETRQVRLFKWPIPRRLFPEIVANETASNGRLHFHVAASMPFIGSLVSYRGSFVITENLL